MVEFGEALMRVVKGDVHASVIALFFAVVYHVSGCSSDEDR